MSLSLSPAGRISSLSLLLPRSWSTFGSTSMTSPSVPQPQVSPSPLLCTFAFNPIGFKHCRYRWCISADDQDTLSCTVEFGEGVPGGIRGRSSILIPPPKGPSLAHHAHGHHVLTGYTGCFAGLGTTASVLDCLTLSVYDSKDFCHAFLYAYASGLCCCDVGTHFDELEIIHVSQHIRIPFLSSTFSVMKKSPPEPFVTRRWNICANKVSIQCQAQGGRDKASDS